MPVNKNISIGFITTVLLFLAVLGDAQNDKLAFSGYVKNMQTALFLNTPPLGQTVLLDELLHHRLNFKWFVNEKITFKAGLRNRLFLGDLVKFNPTYGEQVDESANDFFDLSVLLANKDAVVLHTVLDRLYVEYVSGNWEIKLGRQRINWGINTIWNPNDIFNAFAFTDFDYEEKPGSDAIRIKYYTGFTSSIEIAAKIADNFDDAVIAGLWKFNKLNYDFQILTAYVKQDFVIGGGWAGNLKKAGFKGEFSFFTPLDKQNAGNAFAATIGIDYAFKNSLYLNGGLLFNSLGTTQSNATGLFTFDLSAKNLYPYKWALFTQISYPFTPLLNGGIAIIYSPVKSQALFLNPSLSFSIKENWDINFIGQIIFDKQDKYRSTLQAVFLQLKYSY